MLLAVMTAYVITKYVKHNYTQSEFDIRRAKPNLMVPKFVYRIRREHYVYWEISRIARGLPKTFTYSNWDKNAVRKRAFYDDPPILENDVPC